MLILNYQMTQKQYAVSCLSDTVEVWLCTGISAAVIALYIFFYNKIFAVTFDENFARATGVRTGLYKLVIAVIIAVIIVLAMNLVGLYFFFGKKEK